MPGWTRTGVYGRAASDISIPVCSSSISLSWHFCLEDRKHVLSPLVPSTGSRAQRRSQAVTIRVIDYELANAQGEPTAYRLATSLMDWTAAPAHELTQLYHARWQVEAVFDEMKTHLRQSRRVLRSKAPGLVRQEFYGWVLAHYAVRWLLHQGASRHKLRPADQSFTAHLFILEAAQPQSGAFPSTASKKKASLV